MSTQAQLVLDTVTALRAARTSAGQIVLVVGATTLADGLGGFYRFDPASTAVDDTTTWNVVRPTAIASNAPGRWVRVFQKRRQLASGAHLLTHAGAKTLYVSGTTDSNGEVVVSLTDDDGTALFAEVWMTVAEARPSSLPDASEVVTGTRKALSVDRKQLTYRFARGNATTLGNGLGQLLGAIVRGQRDAPAGVPVTIRVDGM